MRGIKDNDTKTFNILFDVGHDDASVLSRLFHNLWKTSCGIWEMSQKCKTILERTHQEKVSEAKALNSSRLYVLLNQQISKGSR